MSTDCSRVLSDLVGIRVIIRVNVYDAGRRAEGCLPVGYTPLLLGIPGAMTKKFVVRTNRNNRGELPSRAPEQRDHKIPEVFETCLEETGLGKITGLGSIVGRAWEKQPGLGKQPGLEVLG